MDVSSLSGLTALTLLHLDDNAIEDVSALAGLTSLTWLNLSNNGMSDVSLSGPTSLTYLDLSGNGISDVALSGLTSLKTLNLRANSIADVSPLSGLPSLTTLDLSGNAITDISALSGLTSLTTLDLSSNEITDVSPLSDLTALARLDLSGNAISDVSPLSGLTALTLLHLDDNAIEDVSALAGLTSLTWLNLSNNGMSDVSLSGLTALTSLWLSSNTISDVSSLSGLTALTLLDLSYNAISDVSALSGLTSLGYLDLSRNGISNLALSRLTSLTILDLSYNAISDVSALSGLTSLTWLWLSSNTVSDVSALSGLTSLTTLRLQSNPIEEVSALSGLTSLTTLSLSDTGLSDVSPLVGLASLTALWLSGNPIEEVSALSGLTSLTILDLSYNAISDVSPLSGLTSLTWLLLNRNAVADISPLLEIGLSGIDNYVDLRGNPLSEGQADHVRTLRESGVAVVFDDGHRVPLFPSAGRGSSVVGFVRVINHSDRTGSVSIEAVDETGERRGPVSMAINAGQALHFNAADLEQGSLAKGLHGVGEAVGDWRLVLRSDLDIEVLGYARTPDGFVTSLHDLAPETFPGHSGVPTFNPGSNRRQVSRLRLTNPTDWDRRASVTARDDTGSRLATSVPAPARRTLVLTAAQLESGQDSGKDDVDFDGIGDGTGKWRLEVFAPGQRVMSLLQSPTGHLANISTRTAVSRRHPDYYSWEHGGRYRVPLFLAASSDIHGFLRIVNLSSGTTAVTLRAIDEAGGEREPAVLTLRGGRALHLNSNDLESGNAAKGLPGIGAGIGDWHLEVSADRRFEVLAYARTADGFVTSLHDTAPRDEDGSLWIPFFNPGSNRAQASRLRLVNWGGTAADVTIAGTDDAGNSPGEAVRVSVPARSARDYMAWEMETGSTAGLSGALGDGAGKWRLRVSAPADVEAMSLLGLPTGHITNLSTTPRHPRE